jgi:hypothetical protein
MTAVDAHFFGGSGDVAVVLGEFVLDELALVGVGGVFEILEAERA